MTVKQKRKMKKQNLADKRRRARSMRRTLDHVSRVFSDTVNDGIDRIAAIPDDEWDMAVSEEPDAGE